MKLRNVVILLLMAGCGEKFVLPHKKVVRINEFGDYVSAFKVDASNLGHKIKIDDLIVEFGEVEDEGDKTTLARCYVAAGRTPRVVVDRTHWDHMSSVSKKLVIYHELGHCVLQRDHKEEVESIMNAYLLPDYVFLEDETGFLVELFDPKERNTLWKLYLVEHDGEDKCGGIHADAHIRDNRNSHNNSIDSFNIRKQQSAK